MSDLFMKIFGLESSEQMSAQMAGRFKRSLISGLGQEAHLLRRTMVEGLRNQKPGGKTILPLSPMTIALRKLPRKSSKTGRPRKGSTKALIYNGDLIGSTTAQKQDPMHWTVGVHRTARSKDGRSMANLAIIHEKGTRAYTMTVTPKMHRFSKFLVVQGLLKVPWPVGAKLNKKTPARPWLGPAHSEWSKDSEKRMNLRIAKGMGIHGEYMAAIEQGIMEGEGPF